MKLFRTLLALGFASFLLAGVAQAGEGKCDKGSCCKDSKCEKGAEKKSCGGCSKEEKK